MAVRLVLVTALFAAGMMATLDRYDMGPEYFSWLSVAIIVVAGGIVAVIGGG